METPADWDIKGPVAEEKGGRGSLGLGYMVAERGVCA